MDVTQLVEIALANVDRNRVEVTALEPADVAMQAVGGLTHLLTELIDNAIAFSGPGERVGITGVFDRDDYVISIADNGVGIPETLLAALNRVLTDPTSAQTGAATSLGIAMVARTAARHGIDVRLIPAVPGTTARITIPSDLIGPGSSADSPLEEAAARSVIAEAGYRPGHVVAMTESARREAEAFLDRVFGPLRGRTASRRPAKSRSNGKTGRPEAPPPGSPEEMAIETGGRAHPLETRVPGANFTITDDDPSVISGEGAIDIRINLSRFDEGRKQAAESGDERRPLHE